jgi:transposase
LSRHRFEAQWRTGGATIAELVSKHGLHQTLINAWKRQAMDGMAGVFAGKSEAAAGEREGELEKLHAKIGQLVVERDIRAKASGR